MVLAPAVQVLLGLLIVSALMTVLWFVQRRTGNAGIVDAGWAASIGLLGIFYATTSDGYLPRRVLVAVLIRGSSHGRCCLPRTDHQRRGRHMTDVDNRPPF